MAPESGPPKPPPVNPYAPDSGQAFQPQARLPSQYVHPPSGIQYLYMYNYVFESQQWFLNLLLGAVCVNFIPIVGPIVFLGYEFELIDRLHRQPRYVYPDFDFGKFVDYLKRGVWPFLVWLIASFVLAPLFMVLVYGPMIFLLVAVPNAEEVGIAVAVVAIPLIFVLVFGLSLFVSMIVTPIVLRAGLMQEFGAAFHFGFVKDFIRRMWVEMLLGQLFFLVTGPIVMLAGAAICCVGIYPAAVLVMLAQVHLMFQLYELYLVRGGEKIPLAATLPPLRPEMMGPPR